MDSILNGLKGADMMRRTFRVTDCHCCKNNNCLVSSEPCKSCVMFQTKFEPNTLGRIKGMKPYDPRSWKYKGCRKAHFKNDLVLIPTICVLKDSPIYSVENIDISIHFLGWRIGWRWFRE